LQENNLNLFDLLLHETDKVAGFVSYGGHAGGARAIEHLRLITAEVMVATVRASVLLSGPWETLHDQHKILALDILARLIANASLRNHDQEKTP
jgi:NAD(P)H-dependent FMN reductase